MRFGDIVVQRKAPCVLRDGVTLYADIYLPDEDGDFPVLLMRQPYGRQIASTVSYAHPAWYARHGYMAVVQDVRGRGESEGVFVPFANEAEDGYDAVEWAAGLPHSNGKVGMYGFSYQGSAQWAAASLRPPHLAAIAPGMCTADIYHGWMYPFGTFYVQGSLPWAFQLARDAARRAGDAEAEQYCTRMMRHPEQKLWHMPLADKDSVLEQYFPVYYDWVAHPEYDEYWQRLNWLKDFVRHPIPAYHIGGWYDFLLAGTMQSFETVQDGPRTPELFHKLTVGPWTHIPWGRKAGGVDHGPLADGDMHGKQVQWFDYWLKGEKDNGLFEEPAVQYFELGSLKWRAAERFPRQAGAAGETAAAPEPAPCRMYLSGSAKPANGALGGGKLTAATAEIEAAAPDVFVYDARLPMPCESYLPADRSGVQDRYEILVYTGAPLARSLHALGSPKVSVQVQVMDGPTDLVAVLTALYPDGKASFLSIGRTEIGADQGKEDEGWHRAEMTMRPLAAELQSGTAVRLELTGSAFPLLARHPNGVAAKEMRRVGPTGLRIATVAVKSGEGGASWIELPVSDK